MSTEYTYLDEAGLEQYNDKVKAKYIEKLSVSGKTVTYTKGDGSTGTITTQDTTYGAAGSSLGLVKTGGDVTISGGTIIVNDNSHAHTIANVTGLQTALDEKQDEISLTADRALVSDSSGKVAVSDITAEELANLSGIKSNIQTQIDSKSDEGHTHLYAGSSSAGGAATSANKLNTNAGDSNTPVYFADGIPKTCTSLDLNTTGSAAKLTTARTIQTNLASNSSASFDGSVNITPGVTGTLPIANGGTGATTAAKVLTNLGITATADELNYCDGVTSNIQTQLDGKSDDGHEHLYAGSSTAGGSANSAVKLDSSAGYSTRPVYFSDGKPVAVTGIDCEVYPTAAIASSSSSYADYYVLLMEIEADSSYRQATVDFLVSDSEGGTGSYHFHWKIRTGADALTVNTNLISTVAATDTVLTSKLYTTYEIGTSSTIFRLYLKLPYTYHSYKIVKINQYCNATINVDMTGSIGTDRFSTTYEGDEAATNNGLASYFAISNPTSGTSYNIPFTANITTNQAAQSLRYNDGLIYTTSEGTTTVVGSSILKVGNNVSSGTAGNKRGKIFLYSNDSHCIAIQPSTTPSSSDYTITLPNVTGNIVISDSNYAGTATQPCYLASNKLIACTYHLNKTVPSDAVFTDTKNTAGSTDTSSQIYLIGAASQDVNPQTYSHDTVYISESGNLTVEKSDTENSLVNVLNSTRNGSLLVNVSGDLGIYDQTNDTWVIYSDTNQNVYIPHAIIHSTYGGGIKWSTTWGQAGIVSYSIGTGVALYGQLTGSTSWDYSIELIKSDGTINLVPKTGGTFTGAITVNSTITATGNITTTGGGYNCTKTTATDCQYNVTNSVRSGRFVVSSSGNMGIYDTTNNSWIIYSNTSQNVYIPHPLSVTGAITGSSTITASGNITTSGGFKTGNTTYGNGHIELSGGTPFIDFHFGSSTADYTNRIIESSSGYLNVTGDFNISGDLSTSGGSASYTSFNSHLIVGYTTQLQDVTTTARVQPDGDKTRYLGTSSLRWKTIYCQNSTNTTSDLNKKKDIKEIDDRYIQLFDLVQPYTYMFKDGGDRIHTGFISQYVEEAMKQVGLTAEELGFFCKDIKEEAIFDENHRWLRNEKVYDEDGNPVYEYSLRYPEYIAIMAEKIKRLEAAYNKKLELLDEKLAELEEKLTNI